MIRVPAYYTTWLFILLMPAFLFAQDQKPRFTDVSKKAGIDFRYTFGDYTYENILENSGSGITVFDYNGDHLLDLYMMNGTWIEGISDSKGEVFRGTHNKLYENYGANVYYRNNGDGTFTDIAGELGLEGPEKLNGFIKWSVGVALWDHNLDGTLE